MTNILNAIAAVPSLTRDLDLKGGAFAIEAPAQGRGDGSLPPVTTVPALSRDRSPFSGRPRRKAGAVADRRPMT